MSGNVGLKIFGLLAQQEAGDGGVVVDQDTALAVEDLAARGEHGQLADAIGVGEHAIAVRAENLQTPHAGGQHCQQNHDEILGGVQLCRGDFLIAGEVAFGVGVRLTCRGPCLLPVYFFADDSFPDQGIDVVTLLDYAARPKDAEAAGYSRSPGVVEQQEDGHGDQRC